MESKYFAKYIDINSLLFPSNQQSKIYFEIRKNKVEQTTSALCIIDLLDTLIALQFFSLIMLRKQFMKNRLTIILALVLYHTRQLNILITKTSQTCFIVTQGRFYLQYVVSGSEENSVRCIVQQNKIVLLQVEDKSQFYGQFEITQNRGSICFTSMDSQTKSVSFDIVKKDDPLRGFIKDQQKLAIHQSLFKSYQQLQKVHNNQHFFLQRNYVHEILLRNTETSVVFFLLLKLMTIFICGLLQLFYIKIILQNNYKTLQSEEFSS